MFSRGDCAGDCEGAGDSCAETQKWCGGGEQNMVVSHFDIENGGQGLIINWQEYKPVMITQFH